MQSVVRFLLSFSVSVTLVASAIANPTDEVSRAVSVAGATNVSSARPQQFTKAFTAVTMRVSPRDLPEYVIAAVNLRPDLTTQVVAIAIHAAGKHPTMKAETLCLLVERIVKAAIAANPEAAVTIAKASAAAAPQFRRCALAAAIAAAPDAREAIIAAMGSRTSVFAFSAANAGAFSFMPLTLSPANISGPDDAVNSPEQPPSH